MKAEKQKIWMDVVKDMRLYYYGKEVSSIGIIEDYLRFVSENVRDGNALQLVSSPDNMVFRVADVCLAGFLCLVLNEDDAEDIINTLEPEELVIYRKDRYKFMERQTNSAGETECVILQGANKCKTSVPRKLFGKIQPYYGKAKALGGKGIRRGKTEATQFLREMLRDDNPFFSGLTGTSIVLVMDKESTKNLLENIEIGSKRVDKRMPFLDLVTASYYSAARADDSGEYTEHPFRGNPNNTVPMIQVTSDVGLARKLVYGETENEIIGILVADSHRAFQHQADIDELLTYNNSVCSLIDFQADYVLGNHMLSRHPDADCFLCTREFLLPFQEEQSVLQARMDTIINGKRSTEVLQSGIGKERFHQLKDAILEITRFGKADPGMMEFIGKMWTLLTGLQTAVLPLAEYGVVKDIERDEPVFEALLANLSARMRQDGGRIAQRQAEVLELFREWMEVLSDDNPKFSALKARLEGIHNVGKRIAVIVPHDIYCGPIQHRYRQQSFVSVMTPKGLNKRNVYDQIVVCGQVKLRDAALPLHWYAKEVHFLLYDFEQDWFDGLCRQFDGYVRGFDAKMGLTEEKAAIVGDDPVSYAGEDISLSKAWNGLDNWEDLVSSLSYASLSHSAGNVMGIPDAEIVKIGIVEDGRTVFFSKQYKAYAFDEDNNRVDLLPVSKLYPGLFLIFWEDHGKRSDIVNSLMDSIYQQGKMPAETVRAYESVLEWKRCLKEYLNEYGHGCSQAAAVLGVTPAAVRSWVTAESHVLGPREKAQFKAIVAMLIEPKEKAELWSRSTTIIRRYRRSILSNLLPKIIQAKITGEAMRDDVCQSLEANMDGAVSVLRIERIFDMKRMMPVNYANHPIDSRR